MKGLAHMNTRRPWLTGAGLTPHGIAFSVDPGGTGGGAPAPAPGGAGSAAPKTLDQLLKENPHIEAEITGRTQRIAAKEKDQGKNSALIEFARSLGVDDPSVIADTFRRHQEQQTAQMTEAERAKADAERLQAEAAKALQEAKRAKFDAVAIKVLSGAGAEAPEVMAAGLPAFGVDLDSDEDAIAKAVDEMKKRMPGSFGAHAPGTPQASPGTPPTGKPQGSKTGEDNVGSQANRQLERLQNRRGKAPIPGM